LEVTICDLQLREILNTHVVLRRKIEQLEKKYDGQFRIVFEAIRELMTPTERPVPPKKKIGFLAKEPKTRYGKK